MRDDERSAEAAARAPELQALLRELDDLRLSLATDLSLAAAAVEAGSADLAGAVLDSDRAQLRAFEQRALHHLGAPAAAEPPRWRTRRRSLLTAATPLLASAAAVLGVLAGIVPTGEARPPSPAGTQTAMASYHRLTQLTLDGAEPAAVARAAERLHDELAAIVAQASSDPAAAQEALALLESEALVLDSSVHREQLTDVITEARTLVARLRAALPAPVRTPRVPRPTAAPDDVVVPVQAPATPAPPPPPPPAPARSEPAPEAEGEDRSSPPASSPAPASPSAGASSPNANSSSSAASANPARGANDGVLPDPVLPPD